MSTDDVGEQSIMTLGLRYSPASPFVRKVLVFAHETGLADRIELVPTDVWAADSNLFRDNPLGQVPALVSDDGTFIGSALCWDYLDTLHCGSRLIPAVPRERWPVLQLPCAGGRHRGSCRGPRVERAAPAENHGLPGQPRSPGAEDQTRPRCHRTHRPGARRARHFGDDHARLRLGLSRFPPAAARLVHGAPGARHLGLRLRRPAG